METDPDSAGSSVCAGAIPAAFGLALGGPGGPTVRLPGATTIDDRTTCPCTLRPRPSVATSSSEPILPVMRFIINRVPRAGGTDAPSVPIYASAVYGCALAHSPQTTREVRATFYSRVSQYGPHAAPCTCVGPFARTVPGAVPRRCMPGFHRSPLLGFDHR
jgi:hypothetical protein